MVENVVALSCLFALVLPASSGDVSWTGRERHIAVVNPVARPAGSGRALASRHVDVRSVSDRRLLYRRVSNCKFQVKFSGMI